jgi:hypothetical protein
MEDVLKQILNKLEDMEKDIDEIKRNMATKDDIEFVRSDITRLYILLQGKGDS